MQFKIPGLLLLCLSTAFSTSAQSTASKFYNDDWVRAYQPFRIAGNLYYVGTYDLACYLVATKEGLILINTGTNGSGPMILDNIKKLGFNTSDVKILLTGQAHFDHVGGMAEIRKVTGAKMLAQQEDVQVLEDGGKSDFLFGNDPSTNFEPVKVDRIIHDKDTIALGETKVVALHHPGHTKGSTSYLVDVKDETRSWRVLIVNIPSILPQTRLSGMDTYPSVGKDYNYTLDALKKLSFDLWVASHASQCRLHNKRKEGDAYNPSAFNDRPGYEATINTIRKEYEKRLGEEKQRR